ncbi:MAG: sulfatase-like hydrolase/transferase [Anaerolineaceae bacterium]|nr:sulfatase-like hydrolase/transferase [Anaerolineaceae bacterium]
MKKPNIILVGIDSLLADHMSCYGYDRLTTPYIDKFAKGATLFKNYYCPNVPTTSGYGCMLTGMDVMSTQMIALRHKGPLRPEVKTLAEILDENGYETTCIGFSGNPAARGFKNYLNFEGWGAWEDRPATKAGNMNNAAIPELDRLLDNEEPFFLFMRHMDPHSPYLPPAPYDGLFYHGDECDPENKSMNPVMEFKPFCDYFATWMPPGITDKDYVIAQYDGAIAYLDASLAKLFRVLESRGVLDDTIVIINSDHGETLYDHDCYFDHHGIYDVTLHVPLIIHYPSKVPAGKVLDGYTTHPDLVPTILDLAEIESDIDFDGTSLTDMMSGEVTSHSCEFYITECTWMRKHGWRTPEWKLIIALEPDFHFKPEVELYNLIEDPEEYHNLAEELPEVVAILKARMDAWIEKREKETGLPNPIHHQGDWHGHKGLGAFKTSQQAYDTLHIGDVNAATRLQSESRKK